MSNVYDDNLSLLLRRAYKPQRPTPAFRARLKQQFLTRAVRPATPATWSTPLRAAALFMAALVTGFLIWRTTAADPEPTPVAHTPTMDEILDQGFVALREAPDANWRAITREEFQAGLLLNSDYLEVMSPDESGARVRLRDQTGLWLIPRSGVVVRGFDKSTIEPTLGQVSVHLGEVSTPLDITTSEGNVTLEDSRLRVLYLRPYDILVKGSIGDFDMLQPIVRLFVPEGRASFAGPPEVELALKREYFLQDGVLIGEDTGPPDNVRLPVPPGQAAPPPEESKSASLEGRVLIAETQAPLTEFNVWVRQEVPLPNVSEPDRHAFASASGEFQISDLPAGNYTVVIEAAGLAPWKQRGRVLANGAPSALEVALIPASSASGSVIDANGSPIAGALVLAERDLPHQILHAQGVDIEPLPRAHALTDELGAYVIAELSPGRHNLRVSHADYAPGWSTGFELGREGAHALDPIVLAPGGRIFGRVEQSDGNPREGAEVVASYISFSGSALMTFGAAVSAADGSYSIENLPQGYFVVLLIDPGGIVRQASVKAGGETQVDFLGPVTRTRIHGVLYGPDGKPLVGAVNLAPGKEINSYSEWTADMTDASGAYELTDLEPGPYTVYWSESMGEDQIYLTTADVTGDEFELDVHVPNTQLRGTITASVTGEPIAQAGVLAIRVEGDTTYYAGRQHTNARGEYDLRGLPPGTYLLSAADLEGPYAQHLHDRLEVLLAEPLQHDFALELGGHVSVRVLDVAGQPVQGVGVDVTDSQGRQSVCFFPVTDANGLCSYATLAPGTWTASSRGQEVQLEVLRGQPTIATIRLR